MIQAFMANLTRDMKTLSKNSASHATAMEELLYCRFITIEDQPEAWEAYVGDKDE
jgi:hypothetical protein